MATLVSEVAADVFLGRGTAVNFVLVRDGRDVTLIDTGYPGDLGRVLQALGEIGARASDVAAILLTHAHIDHIGGANHFADEHGTPIYTGAREAQHARREFLEQASRADVARNVLRPRTVPWLTRVMRVGVTKEVAIPTAQAFADGLELPGNPRPVATPGHTSGHTAYLLAGARAVVSGDALVTGHPLLREDGPSLLPGFFNSGDPVPALDTFAALDADLLLPGHGDPLRRPMAEIAAAARP